MPAKRAGQMSDGGVDGDEQVQSGDGGGGVGEIGQVCGEIGDAEFGGCIGKVEELVGGDELERDELDVRVGERGEFDQRN